MLLRISDPSLPFGGTWTFDITPVAGGCVLRITEDGIVYNPIFRTLGRFVLGYHMSILGYLRSLAAHYGATQPPRVVR
jgi:hypothetical protein